MAHTTQILKHGNPALARVHVRGYLEAGEPLAPGEFGLGEIQAVLPREFVVGIFDTDFDYPTRVRFLGGVLFLDELIFNPLTEVFFYFPAGDMPGADFVVDVQVYGLPAGNVGG